MIFFSASAEGLAEQMLVTYACHLARPPPLQLPHRDSTTAMPHSQPQSITSSRHHTKPQARNSINA
jgi:hypothetical protein